MRLARFALWLSALASLAGARAAAAAEAIADAGASAALPAALAPRSFSACVEHIPEGKTRPAMTESFPERAKAGYAATLHLELQHGLGESVLPGGFKLQLDSPEGKALGRAQFVIPALEGPAAPRISRTQTGSAATTSVDLSFVPLPKEPGPHTLTLPSVPIAIARQSGELITVCTQPHTLKVDKLIILSNVPGLLRDVQDEGSLIRDIPFEDIEEFAAFAKGRMKKKVLGAVEAIREGVKEVVFADARRALPITEALLGKGTLIH